MVVAYCQHYTRVYDVPHNTRMNRHAAVSSMFDFRRSCSDSCRAYFLHFAAFWPCSKLNLGMYLLNFFDFYANQLNFVTTGLSLRGSGTLYNKIDVRERVALDAC